MSKELLALQHLNPPVKVESVEKGMNLVFGTPRNKLLEKMIIIFKMIHQ